MTTKELEEILSAAQNVLQDGENDRLAERIHAARKWFTLPLEPTGERFYGKDCPVGMVQVEFVSVGKDLRYSDYGWKPSRSAMLDIYVDGRRYNIQVGDCQPGYGTRRGLHIVTDLDVKVDTHSINALDVYFDAPPRSQAVAKDSDGTQAGDQPVPPGVENINERHDLPPSPERTEEPT